MRASQSELKRLACEPFSPAAGLGQIEQSRVDWPIDYGRRPRAKTHATPSSVFDQFFEGYSGANTTHWPNEILDHSVRFGVIDVEAIQLAVANQINARVLLNLQDYACCICQRLFGRSRREPIRNWV
jgi:hypothetical protein